MDIASNIDYLILWCLKHSWSPPTSHLHLPPLHVIPRRFQILLTISRHQVMHCVFGFSRVEVTLTRYFIMQRQSKEYNEALDLESPAVLFWIYTSFETLQS